MKRLLTALLLLPFAAIANDDTELRAAAERYEAVAGIARMLQDTQKSLASRLPEDKRTPFIEELNARIDVEGLRQTALDAMLEHFTVDELNALADFYGSDVGQSILGKFGAYNARVTPKVMQDVLQAAEEARQAIEE